MAITKSTKRFPKAASKTGEKAKAKTATKIRSRSPAAASPSSPQPAAGKASTKRGAGSKSAAVAPSVAAQLPPATAARKSAARKKFEQGIVTRGEAVPAGKPLTRGATHVIVGNRADGTPILKRKRFSLT
jgi:hypothetical protein